MLLGEAESAEPRAEAARRTRRPAVRHIGRYAQIHFGARSRPAPDVELRAEPLRPLAHAGQAEVPGSFAGIEDIVADAAPIVPDPDLECRLAVRHFDFDRVRPGMLERVAQRLAADEVSFLAHDRVEV